MRPDDAADQTAGATRSDGAETEAPDYLATAAPPGSRSRSSAWIVASLVAVLLLGGAATLSFARERGTRTDPDAERTTELAPAAPWDGKASLRLPVTITPNRDLVDGQEVTVTATGFPPNADLGVIMCTSEAAFAGIDACDIGTALSSLKGIPVMSDAQGNVSTRYRVSTRISVPAGDPRTTPANQAPTSIVMDDGSIAVGATVPEPATIDCASGDIDPDVWPSVIPATPTADPGGFTCIVAVGMISDYDTSGGAAVGFEGATFQPVEATTTTDPGGGDPSADGPVADPTPSPVDPPAPGGQDPGAPLTTVVPPSSRPPVTAPSSSTTTNPDPPPPPVDPALPVTTTEPP